MGKSHEVLGLHTDTVSFLFKEKSLLCYLITAFVINTTCIYRFLNPYETSLVKVI